MASSVSKLGADDSNVVAQHSEKLKDPCTPVDAPKKSWKNVQYPPGSTGHKKKPSPPVDKAKQMEYVKKILSSKVYDVAVETPLRLAPILSSQCKNNIWLKREDTQQIFSFKIRGAYNMMSQIPREILDKGVVCASAGNHAQGVALAAKKLKIKATVFMPETTPKIKIDAVKRLGGIVKLVGDDLETARYKACKWSKKKDQTLIVPDHKDVIAGQGTVGMEIARQIRDKVHAIFVPVGGGSQVCGIACYYKFLYPEVLIFGVQLDEENSMAEALHFGEIVNVHDIDHFADGIAIKQVGDEAFRICWELVDDIILVNKHMVAVAIKDMFNDERSILEPSGALSIAAAKAYCDYNNIREKEIVAVTSGANMNFDQLREILDLIKIDQSIVASILPEEPGSLKNLTDLIIGFGISITEMTYRFSQGSANVVVYKVNVGGSKHQDMMNKLNHAGFTTYNLSENPIAENHLRHMIGGRAKVENETLFRFRFPEKQGALQHFLKGFQPNWNISLFHHRPRGVISSDVLVGIQMEKSEGKNFDDYAKSVGYLYEMISPDDSAHILLKL